MSAEEKFQVSQVAKTAVALFLFLSIVTGILYPLAVFAAGQALFSKQSHGSLLYYGDGGVAGSELIGQAFTGDEYFWSRPSATAEKQYNALASGGSNYGPTNKNFISGALNRTALFKEEYKIEIVPSDLVMSSASGLDPDISVESAMLQVERVAKARGMDPEVIRGLVAKHTEGKTLGILGKERVNVVLLNRELDLPVI
jgi:potassium-transporting ATPase KdpC subunit